MNRICKVGISQCPGVDSPVTNLSSEAPDPLIFTGIIYDPINPYQPPCLGCDPGDQFIAHDCFGRAFSVESQELANLFARLAGMICKEPLAQQFTNDPQTATCQCEGGATFSYTVPAGFMAVSNDPNPAAWIAAANAAALAYAEQQVANLEQRSCIHTTDLLPHPGWMCLGEELLSGATNTYTITGLNSADDWVFNLISGTLPNGVSLDQVSNNSAEITGTPTVPGVYTYTIEAYRPTMPNQRVSVTDTLRVLGITNPVLPDGTVGTPYLDGTDPVVILTAGGVAPVTFTANPATLPDGLTLASDGTISGTPTTAGQFAFDVTFTDAEGRVCVKDVTIEVFGSCPDWTQLLWGVPAISTAGAGTASFTPNSVVSDSFHATADAPDAFNFTDGGTSQNGATLSYNGPGCNCNAHVILSRLGTDAAVLTSITWQIDAGPITELISTNISGTYDFAFVIPDTGGVPVTINIAVIAACPQAFVGVHEHEHAEITCTFSNVP